MPHMTVEYSSNLDEKTDIGVFCRELAGAILSTGLFEIGAIRVRAHRAEHYAIADFVPENAFVDLNFRIGKGRSAEEKRRAGEAVFSAASTLLAPLFDAPHFALSLEIREIDADLSWKKNAIHTRLRGR